MLRLGLLRRGAGLEPLCGGGVTELGVELMAALPLGLMGQATEGVELATANKGEKEREKEKKQMTG